MENNQNRVLVDRLYHRVEEAFKDKKNVRYLTNSIQSFADKHSNILLTTDMSMRLIFSDADKKIIYNATGISEEEVKSVLQNAPAINNIWKKAMNPFYMLSLVIIHYFYSNGSKENISYGDALTVYLGYLLYTTNHKCAFPHAPNKQCMDYTINNLNNRFLIKQEGNIQTVIEHTVVSAMHDRFLVEIKRGNDEDFTAIISSLDTRISSFVNNIADEFYINHKAGKYLFHEDEDLDEKNYHLSDNKSFKIERIVQTVTSEIITKGFDQNNVVDRSVAIVGSGVSKKKVEAMLRTIVEFDMKNIPEMISCILTLFMYKGTDNTIDDVKTMKFVSESLQIYKSNAQDDVTYHIKDILLDWINLTSEKYGRSFISKGKTSLDNYRKVIYHCFVFEIYECCK